MKMEKLLSILCTVSLMSNMITTPAFAGEFSDDTFTNTQESTLLESAELIQPTSIEMIQALDKASCMLDDGLISEEEFNAMLLDIYQINTATRASGDYYPAVQAGYINHEGVVYLHEEGLDKAKTAEGVIAIMASTIPGAGWGISAVGVAVSYGGKSDLEKAVNKAYFAGKGIKVYYQIHVSVQSYNRVIYVVG